MLAVIILLLHSGVGAVAMLVVGMCGLGVVVLGIMVVVLGMFFLG